MNKKFFVGLGGFLRMIWTFFPSLLFILLTMYAFWDRAQGKDILVAFTEEKLGWIYWGRLFFFLVIGFWVYLTWYSSRTIAYIKFYRQSGNAQIPEGLLLNYPRMAANACFLVLELSVWQAPIFKKPLSSTVAFVILVLGLVLLYFIDRLIRRKWKIKGHEERAFNLIRIGFGIFVILAVVGAMIDLVRVRYLYVFFALLVLLHVLYLFYSNLHHLILTARAPTKAQMAIERKDDVPRGIFQRVMYYFSIPADEISFFKWFNWVSLAAIIVDGSAIIYFPFAVGLGPFPVIILGFAVLLGLINLITAFSVKYAVNFHLLLFVLAFFTGKILGDAHYVRVVKPAALTNGYKHRVNLEHYLREWLKRVPDTGRDAAKPYAIYFVLADGGASRSGYWTASVLGELQDASMHGDSMHDSTGSLPDSTRWFSRHLFCLSGTSGGGVGVAAFYSLLHDPTKPVTGDSPFLKSARAFLRQDFFTYTAARLLGPDYFYYIFPFFKPLLKVEDRAGALEEGLEAFKGSSDTTLSPHFDEPFSNFPAVDSSGSVRLPILFVNTTRMQDGNPGLVSNLDVSDTAIFGRRIDVLSTLGSDSDVTMATAAILGARFPYLSPAGRIGNQYFVDGGYFDNSGAGAVQELIRGVLNIAAHDSVAEPIFKKVFRLRFKVLHILNSPIGDTTIVHPVAPLSNDLFAPVLTIVGAYDMQTTVNDVRLSHYLEDMQGQMGIPANYIRISLYENGCEWYRDPLRCKFHLIYEPAYSMNWFMADTTRCRIDRRLREQPVVNRLVWELQHGGGGMADTSRAGCW